MSDTVYSPEHYNSGKIEVIEYIEDQGWGRGFCLGNAVKYISRAGKKDATKALEDLQKARWYLNRVIDIELENALAEGQETVRSNDMNANKTSPHFHYGEAEPQTDLEKEAWEVMKQRGNVL